MFRLFSVLLVVGLVASCSQMPEIPYLNQKDEPKPLEEVEDITLSAKELYKSAKSLLDEGRYKKAIKDFEEIERVYPFDKLATKAQVMIAYANYKNEYFEDAVSVIDKYISLNPASEDVIYMYYLKALSYYDRIADIKRDQLVTTQALSALKELVTRYPDSGYSRDAKLKIDLVEDHLAGKHMEIGRFYLKDNKLIAAINRFQKVVDKYQSTNHIEEALYRLTESYLVVGLKDEAKKNAATLGNNYPESKWYRYAYALIKEETNAPKAEGDSWWKPDLGFSFGGPESASDNPLPKDNLADSWLDNIIDVF